MKSTNNNFTPTPQQKMYILRYLESNYKDLFEDDLLRQEKKEVWANLAEKLNVLGGVQKSASQWLKYWYDQRSYIRMRDNDYMRDHTIQNSTSGRRPLNDNESGILALPLIAPEHGKTDNSLFEDITHNEYEFILPNDRTDETERTNSDDSNEPLAKKIKIECNDNEPKFQQPGHNRTPQYSNTILDISNIKSEWTCETSTVSVPYPAPNYRTKEGQPSDQDSLTLPILTEIKSEPSEHSNAPFSFSVLYPTIDTQPSDHVDVPAPIRLKEESIKTECSSSPSDTIFPSPDLYTIVEIQPNDHIRVPRVSSTEVSIKSETNDENLVPFSEFYSITETQPYSVPITENIKSETEGDPNTMPISNEQTENTVTIPKSKPLVRFSKAVEITVINDFCEDCKSKANKFTRDIKLQRLAIMKETEKFNRQMGIKKLRVEARKIEILNKFTDVVQSGFGQIASTVIFAHENCVD